MSGGGGKLPGIMVTANSTTNYRGRKSGGKGGRGYPSLEDELLKGLDADGQKVAEKIEVLAMEGYGVDDPKTWLKVAQEMGEGVTKRPLFSGRLALAPGQKFANDEAIQKAAKMFLKKHGLEDHPFLLVRHSEKELKSGDDSREGDHIHVIASRINPETGKLVSDRSSQGKNRSLSFEIAKELRLKPVTASRDYAGKYSRKEIQALKESGWTPQKFKTFVQKEARKASTQDDFLKALAKENIVLARHEKFKQRLIFAAQGKDGKFHALGTFSRSLNGLQSHEYGRARTMLTTKRGFQTIKSLNNAGFRGYTSAAKARAPKKPIKKAPKLKLPKFSLPKPSSLSAGRGSLKNASSALPTGGAATIIKAFLSPSEVKDPVAVQMARDSTASAIKNHKINAQIQAEMEYGIKKRHFEEKQKDRARMEAGRRAQQREEARAVSPLEMIYRARQKDTAQMFEEYEDAINRGWLEVWMRNWSHMDFAQKIIAQQNAFQARRAMMLQPPHP